MESDSGARHAPGHQRCQDRCHEYTALALCHVTSGRGTVVAANTLTLTVAYGSLEPDLNFVAIRISDVSVGEAGGELATTEQAPSGAFDLGDGMVDVPGVHEPKAEMRYAALRPAVAGSSAKVRMSCRPDA